ncbi:MAG: Ig-like domain-containing protein [Saprospiraceae bacterium]|nr:Ig-like domain-containing protein [Saprospiraceae bacterium]
MKTKYLLIFGFLASFFFAGQKSYAQVESVNYWMKYDSSTCNYDCYVIINAGSTSTPDHRIAFNAQYSIVLQTGDSIVVDSNYWPKVGASAAAWNISSRINAPAAQPANDFWSIVPTISPTAYYPVGTQAGDTIKLFSIRKIGTTTLCGEDIRIFINGVDPNSAAAGMEGSDFNNGFTMGSTSQLYNANSTQATAPVPTILSVDASCAGGIEIDLTATTSACQGPLTYAWTGPAAFSSTTEDVSIPTATSANNGTYTVVVTDAIGCIDSIDVVASSKPDAGSNVTICAGLSDTITGSPLTIPGVTPINGAWTAVTGNPAGATLTVLSTGVSRVAFSNASSGTYRFKYTLGACSDTMQFSVNPKPTVTMLDASACIGETVNVTPSTLGTWISSNSGVATITNAGLVTAVGQGICTFTYTRSATGCSSTTGTFTVNPPPTLAFPGPDDVCISGTIQVNPATGGTWTSSNTLIATVTNAGVVTGVSFGSVTLTYIETATGCSGTIGVDVKLRPSVTISGNDSICIGATTTLTPTTGGTWDSTDPLVASVNNAGLVTGLTAGTTTFIYTDASTGCSSDETDTVRVSANPTVTISGASGLCIGGTTTLTPNTGGTWVSDIPAVATVTNGGIVTAVSQGQARFTFTNTSTGCSAQTGAVLVNPKPPVSAANDTICVGSTTTISPALTAGTTWANHTSSIVSMTGAPVKIVTGLDPGTAKLVFQSNNGCYSDTLEVEVLARPIVSITGDNFVCAGSTTLLDPTTGGTWMSSDAGVATVNNAGVVTGVSPGTASFTFTSSASLCVSDPTAEVTVTPTPVVSITGAAGICIGDSTTMSPTSGGTWVSDNPTVATISSMGVVTGVSAGFARFTFTDAIYGCASAKSAPITVNLRPSVSFTGPSALCIGGTTTVTPTTGGVWASSDEAVATINNAGLVTAISSGSVSFTFTQNSTFCPSNPLNATITLKPTVSITGDTTLCIGSTSTLSPTTGGTWSSSNNAVATVTPGGVVTAVAQGVVFFTFINDGGCSSDPTDGIIVNNPTPVSLPDVNICIADTLLLSPSTGGTWSSTTPATATVSGSTVTGVAAGTTEFIFTDTITGCVSPATAQLTVDPKPITVLLDNNTCVGVAVNITPNVGGTWASSDIAIATVTNTGVITPVSPGNVTFTFTKASNGCDSDPSAALTVEAGPSISPPNDDQLCLGEITTLTPAAGGTWESSNVAVATITNGGVVTAVGQGIATFTFTSSATSCKSQASAPVTVNGKPTTFISGSDEICIGGLTQLFPGAGGTWASSDAGVASVDNAGVVTGNTAGTATFTFTDTSTGCIADATLPVTVSEADSVSILGIDVVCVGGTTTVGSSSVGTWTSSNTAVATIDNNGLVTSVAPGKVVFTFTSSTTGCDADATTDTITIVNCTNPDFNATFVDVSVDGDVSTNDGAGGGTAYGTPNMISKPTGSVPNITMNADGTYTFTSNLVGVYRYTVPVCVPPLVSGCPTSDLTITVVDYVDPARKPVANVDFATTFLVTPVELNTLSNDKCVVINGCSLDEAGVTITINPNHGSALVDGMTGNITYTPDPGFTGQDTLTYQVCVLGEAANCATSKQIISVSNNTADNITVAADDFNTTQEETAVSGNVSDNDTDPEGDTHSVTAQNTTVAAGTLVLNTDGSYTFTPVKDFFGPVEFIYNTCDDNAVQACVDATLHLLVIPDLTVKVRVYLEGSLMENQGATASDGRPLMRDALRDNGFNTGTRYIPNMDPYKFTPTKYTEAGLQISTEFDHVVPGGTPNTARFDSVKTPTAVFAITGQEAIVDWVFIELRSKADSTVISGTRSGLLQRDGDVVDLDGYSGLKFPGMAVDSYYVVVRHRSHLGSMTLNPQTPRQLMTLVNFTKADQLDVWDYGTNYDSNYDYSGLAMNNDVKFGYRALWAGTFDINGKVKADNPGDDLNTLFFDVFGYPDNTSLNVNYDFAFGYMPGDFNMDGKSKYDNPNDDKNMLYAQLLFFPLNTGFLSNFDFFIQQIP